MRFGGVLTNDSLSLSQSKSLIDEMWSVGTDKQEVAFFYPDMSERGEAVYCMSTLMHYSVLPCPPPPVT